MCSNNNSTHRRLQQLIQYRYDTSSRTSSRSFPLSSRTSDTYSTIRSRTSGRSSQPDSSQTSDSVHPLPYIPRARFYRRGTAIEDRYSDVSSEMSATDVRNILSDNFTFAANVADSDGNVQYRWDFDVDRSDTRSFKIRRPRVFLDSPYADSSAASTTSVSIGFAYFP